MVTSRIWFTAAQKAELWERWKNGQSAAAISRALESPDADLVNASALMSAVWGKADSLCSARVIPSLSSRAEEFHLRALPEPCVNLSIHTAPDVRPLP